MRLIVHTTPQQYRTQPCCGHAPTLAWSLTVFAMASVMQLSATVVTSFVRLVCPRNRGAGNAKRCFWNGIIGTATARSSSPTHRMDPLSATASIIAVLQLSHKVIGYLNDVKDASKDRARCAIEAANLNSLLTALRFRLEEEETNSTMPWYTAIRALAVENGPLDQFKQALEELQNRMTGGSGSRAQRFGDVLVWKFKKEEIASILSRMERLKTLIQVALQMDQL
jgi:hypothetical protein